MKKDPRKKISGSRDVLIHDYFAVDTESVWETVIKDLTRLKKEIKKLQEEF